MKQKIQLIANVDIPKDNCYGCDLCYDCVYCMVNSEIPANSTIPKNCPIMNGHIISDVVQLSCALKKTDCKYVIDDDIFKNCLQNSTALDCLIEIISRSITISTILKKDIELHLKGVKL